MTGREAPAAVSVRDDGLAQDHSSGMEEKWAACRNHPAVEMTDLTAGLGAGKMAGFCVILRPFGLGRCVGGGPLTEGGRPGVWF